MRLLSSLIAIFIISQEMSVQAQTWKTISKTGTYENIPYNSFKINPYNNSIWLIRDTKVSVIENDGSINIFTNAELGTLWEGDNIQFAFTPTEVFYNIDVYGFHSFTGYSSNIIDASIGDFKSISSNSDTIYIAIGDFNTFKKYCNGTFQTFYRYYEEIDAKNQFLYGIGGTSAIYKFVEATNTSVNLIFDPDYLFSTFHDTKFSRHTDTFYVAGKKGISFAYNYDFLDTITPNNTLNMPSANVLEIEFDHQDSLWAVFGDVNDAPFAIAKLEGTSWTTIYDESNSPIDFSHFLGLEIDTLGNLWVVDNMALHTLLTPNSPTWLGLNELDAEQELTLFPNPASESFSIQHLPAFDVIKVIDLQGRVVLESEANETIDIRSIQRGNYLVQVFSKGQVQNLKLVKE